MMRRNWVSNTSTRWVSVLAVLMGLASVSSLAQESYRQQMKGLDEQVQEIKSEALNIAAELNGLEEKLLYPSNTHFAVFVAMPASDTFRLDSVQIEIDGQPAAHYIYSFKELEALQKGGVQRIYTGNIATGEHQMQVVMSGKSPSGQDVTRTERFSFTKGIEPRLLNLTVGASELKLAE